MSPEKVAEARELIDQLFPSLRSRYLGQYIAVDPISKEYFIDAALAGALTKAKAKFQDREFYTTKIGQRSAITFSH